MASGSTRGSCASLLASWASKWATLRHHVETGVWSRLVGKHSSESLLSDLRAVVRPHSGISLCGWVSEGIIH
jgi:hypothetical protein